MKEQRGKENSISIISLLSSFSKISSMSVFWGSFELLDWSNFWDKVTPLEYCCGLLYNPSKPCLMSFCWLPCCSSSMPSLVCKSLETLLSILTQNIIAMWTFTRLELESSFYSGIKSSQTFNELYYLVLFLKPTVSLPLSIFFLNMTENLGILNHAIPFFLKKDVAFATNSTFLTTWNCISQINVSTCHSHFRSTASNTQPILQCYLQQ